MSLPQSGENSSRIRAALSIGVVVPLGLAAKFYPGPLHDWVNNSLGGVFYVVFWCLVVPVFQPRAAPRAVATVVLVLTCGLEVLQLWHPPFLQLLRSSFVGATILGSQFAWSDFPYYIVGSIAGWKWLEAISRSSAINRVP